MKVLLVKSRKNEKLSRDILCNQEWTTSVVCHEQEFEHKRAQPWVDTNKEAGDDTTVEDAEDQSDHQNRR